MNFDNVRLNKISKKVVSKKAISNNDIVFIVEYLNKFKNNDAKNLKALLLRYNVLYDIVINYNIIKKEKKVINEVNSIINNNAISKYYYKHSMCNKYEYKKSLKALNMLFKDNTYSINDNDNKFIRIVNNELLLKFFKSNKIKLNIFNDYKINNDTIILDIDLDLMKKNEFKLKWYNCIKIVFYHYDITKTFILIDEIDLNNINNDFNFKTLSIKDCLLDYKHKSYYDCLNNKDNINIAFKSIKNNDKKVLKDLDINFKIFNDFKPKKFRLSIFNLTDLIYNLDLEDNTKISNILKTLDIDLNSDLYNSNFDRILNNAINDLELVLNDLETKKDNIQLSINDIAINNKTLYSNKLSFKVSNTLLSLFNDLDSVLNDIDTVNYLIYHLDTLHKPNDNYSIYYYDIHNTIMNKHNNKNKDIAINNDIAIKYFCYDNNQVKLI